MKLTFSIRYFIFFACLANVESCMRTASGGGGETEVPGTSRKCRAFRKNYPHFQLVPLALSAKLSSFLEMMPHLSLPRLQHLLLVPMDA